MDTSAAMMLRFLLKALGLDQEKGWLSKPGWKGLGRLQLRRRMGDKSSKGHAPTSISHMPSFSSSFLCFSLSFLLTSSPIHPPLSTSLSDFYCPKHYCGLLALIVGITYSFNIWNHSLLKPAGVFLRCYSFINFQKCIHFFCLFQFLFSLLESFKKL